MVDRVALLIEVLFDPTAREDERHDAVMDLGRYADERGLKALVRVGSNASEEDIILDSCGESVAEILVSRDEFRKDVINKLAPFARDVALNIIQQRKPQWLEGERGQT